MIRKLLILCVIACLLMSPALSAATITLSWIAPGDDGAEGTASEYDLRYSEYPIYENNFEQATRIEGLMSPSESGIEEVFYLGDIDDRRNYFFAIKAGDEIGNWSAMSNVPVLSICNEGCIGMRGNANNDPAELVNISDLRYLLDYLSGIPMGPPPVCPLEANMNGDSAEKINVSDITRLVNYLFGIPLGPSPPACP